jgi:hypothetical protein
MVLVASSRGFGQGVDAENAAFAKIAAKLNENFATANACYSELTFEFTLLQFCEAQKHLAKYFPGVGSGSEGEDVERVTRVEKLTRFEDKFAYRMIEARKASGPFLVQRNSAVIADKEFVRSVTFPTGIAVDTLLDKSLSQIVLDVTKRRTPTSHPPDVVDMPWEMIKAALGVSYDNSPGKIFDETQRPEIAKNASVNADREGRYTFLKIDTGDTIRLAKCATAQAMAPVEVESVMPKGVVSTLLKATYDTYRVVDKPLIFPKSVISQTFFTEGNKKEVVLEKRCDVISAHFEARPPDGAFVIDVLPELGN